MSLQTDTNPHNNADHDPLYQQAVEIVLKYRSGSVSLVQRHLRLGYERAQKLLDHMQVEGIVSEIQENGLREVLTPLAQNEHVIDNKSTAEDSALRAVTAMHFLSMSKSLKK